MKNDIAHEMLKNNPKKLICTPEFQQSITKIVQKFKQRGGFARESEADIVQEITTRILEQRIPYLQKNYNPKYGHLKQYFEKMVYNIGVELVSSANRRHNTFYNLDMATTQQLSNSNHLRQELILDELKKLHIFLTKSNRQKAKLWLLLKLYSRSTITSQDIVNYNPTITREEIEGILKIFGQNFAQHEDGFLYDQIRPLMNQVEGKKNSADALRKWLGNRLTDMSIWMNRHSTFQYDKEALRNLMQLFFSKQAQFA